MAIRLAGKKGRPGSDASTLVTGIDPTGATDATAAIQAAIDSVDAEIGEDGGGLVTLPLGIFTVGTIQLRNHVLLAGQGDGTVLKAKTNIGGPVIQNAADGDRFFGLMNIRVDGNKSAQSTGSGRHGLHLNCPSTSPQEYADSYWKLFNVTVVNCKDDGFKAEGRGEGKLVLVNVRDCDGIGFNLSAPDCDLNLCSAGGAGKQGFYIAQANNRLSNCKAFYAGNVDGSVGHGFQVEATHSTTLLNCEAQDNNFHGFWAHNSDRVQLLGCNADSNNAGHNSDSDRSGNGFQIDGSSYCQITGYSRDRGLVASGNTRQQKYGLGMANGASYLKANLEMDGNATGNVQNGWHTNVDISINGYGGQQDLSYAASRTPNPTLGNLINIGALTGGITINAPSAANSWTGATMTLKFTQDGTGGRAVTWGSGIKANWSPNTGAGKVNVIQFTFDGSDWIQTASAVNL